MASSRRTLALLCVYLVVSADAIQLHRAIDAARASPSSPPQSKPRTRRKSTALRAGKTRSFAPLTLAPSETPPSPPPPPPSSAVLLQLDTKGLALQTGTLQNRFICGGICTAAAIGIAVAAAAVAGTAMGVSVAALKDARTALVRLEAVRERMRDSRLAECTVVRHMVFEARSFQLLALSFMNAIRVIGVADNDVQFRLKGMARTLEGYSDEVVNLLAQMQAANCGAGSEGSDSATAVHNAVVAQFKAVKAKTKALVMDSIAFVVSVVAAVGTAVGGAVGSQATSAIVSAFTDTVTTAKDVVEDAIEVGTPVLEAVVAAMALQKKAELAAAAAAAGDSSVSVSVADHVEGKLKLTLTPARLHAAALIFGGALSGDVLLSMLKKHGVDAAKGIGKGMSKVVGKTAGKAAMKSMKAALAIAGAAFGLVMAVKHVFDRFTDLFNSREEYAGREASASVNGFLVRAEQKARTCSLARNVHAIQADELTVLRNVVALVEKHGAESESESESDSESDSTSTSGGGAESPWQEHKDPTSGELYYHNSDTGETTWTCPFPCPLDTPWQEHKDADTGKPYYHNPDTGDTTWKCPFPCPLDTAAASPSPSPSSLPDQQRATGLVKKLCQTAVHTCHRVLGDGSSLGSGDAGAAARDLVLTAAVRRRLAELVVSGPITDIAVSSNADETAMLREMGFFLVTPQPLTSNADGSRRLWACRVCSDTPIVQLRTTTARARDVTKDSTPKKGEQKKEMGDPFASYLRQRAYSDDSGGGGGGGDGDGGGAVLEGSAWDSAFRYIKLGPAHAASGKASSGEQAFSYLTYFKPTQKVLQAAAEVAIPVLYSLGTLSMDPAEGDTREVVESAYADPWPDIDKPLLDRPWKIGTKSAKKKELSNAESFYFMLDAARSPASWQDPPAAPGQTSLRPVTDAGCKATPRSCKGDPKARRKYKAPRSILYFETRHENVPPAAFADLIGDVADSHSGSGSGSGTKRRDDDDLLLPNEEPHFGPLFGPTTTTTTSMVGTATQASMVGDEPAVGEWRWLHTLGFCDAAWMWSNLGFVKASGLPHDGRAVWFASPAANTRHSERKNVLQPGHRFMLRSAGCAVLQGGRLDLPAPLDARMAAGDVEAVDISFTLDGTHDVLGFTRSGWQIASILGPAKGLRPTKWDFDNMLAGYRLGFGLPPLAADDLDEDMSKRDMMDTLYSKWDRQLLWRGKLDDAGAVWSSRRRLDGLLSLEDDATSPDETVLEACELESLPRAQQQSNALATPRCVQQDNSAAVRAAARKGEAPPPAMCGTFSLGRQNAMNVAYNNMKHHPLKVGDTVIVGVESKKLSEWGRAMTKRRWKGFAGTQAAPRRGRVVAGLVPVEMGDNKDDLDGATVQFDDDGDISGMIQDVPLVHLKKDHLAFVDIMSPSRKGKGSAGTSTSTASPRCKNMRPRIALVVKLRNSATTTASDGDGDVDQAPESLGALLRKTVFARQEAAQQALADFLCATADPKAAETELMAAAAAGSTSDGRVADVQALTCHFRGDEPKAVGRATRAPKWNDKTHGFPLRDWARGVKGVQVRDPYCKWKLPSPLAPRWKRLGYDGTAALLPSYMGWRQGPAMTLLDDNDVWNDAAWGALGGNARYAAGSDAWNKLAEDAWRNKKPWTLDDLAKATGGLGQDPLPTDPEDGGAVPAPSVAVEMLLHFFATTECRFRVFWPIRFSKECTVKKVDLSADGVITERCGEEQGGGATAGAARARGGGSGSGSGSVSQLPLLAQDDGSAVYVVEALFVTADNKRRSWHGHSTPSSWPHPTVEETKAAFERGWVVLPTEYEYELPKKYVPARTDGFVDVVASAGGDDGDTGEVDASLFCEKYPFYIYSGAQRKYLFNKDGAPNDQTPGAKECRRWVAGDRWREKGDMTVKQFCMDVCFDDFKKSKVVRDILGDNACIHRCGNALGQTLSVKGVLFGERDWSATTDVQAISTTALHKVKLKLRLWMQPDERMTSDAPPWVVDKERCRVCGGCGDDA